jgi:hypothetical protein
MGLGIAIVLPHVVSNHRQGDLWGFPFLLIVPVCSATKPRVLPRVLFVLPDSSSLGGAL